MPPQDRPAYEGQLPNREPACPRKPISIEEADRDSAVGRNNVPYNDGGQPHAVIEPDNARNGNTVPGRRGASGNNPVN